jgi:hypothetical protein
MPEVYFKNSDCKNMKLIGSWQVKPQSADYGIDTKLFFGDYKD